MGLAEGGAPSTPQEVIERNKTLETIILDLGTYDDKLTYLNAAQDAIAMANRVVKANKLLDVILDKIENNLDANNPAAMEIYDLVSAAQVILALNPATEGVA